MRFASLSRWVSFAFAVFVLRPGSVQAGPVEQMTQLAVHPTDPDVMAIRYINGGDEVLYSQDGGASWNLLCLSAIDVAIRRSGPMAITGDGHTLMGVFNGLYEDTGGGCGWTAEPSLQAIWISDLAAHPTDPGVMFAASSLGGEGKLNGIVRRDESGAYERFGIQEELLITRLRVTATETGLRFYESVIMGMIPGTVNGMATEVPNYLIRVSDDDAATFEAFPFGAIEGAFRLVAVDPGNPDRIVAVIDHEGENDQLLVSADRGATFDPYLALSQFSSLAFGPDGRVFIGETGVSTNPDASVGLWSAASLDETPEKLAEYPVNCLHYEPTSDRLLVCQRWSFGTADRSDGAFTELLKFTTVLDFIACDGADMAATCEPQLCRDYCALGHFAQAPVCEAYDQPFCGPCAATMEGSTDAQCSTGGAGTSGGGGTGGDAGSAAAGAGGSATAGSGAPDAGTPADGGGRAGEGGGGGGGGGCSCTTARGGSTHALAGLGALLFAITWRTRRRR